jgi:Protein of unknown function (DUF3017)
MANRPVNTGSGGAAAPPSPDAALPYDAADPYGTAAPPVGHRAGRDPRSTRTGRAARATQADGDPGTSALAWLPYLIVLAGVAAGMFVAWNGSRYAGRGAGVIGASLLAGATARLILPARYAGLLSSRRKASDVLALAVFGAAVLAVAIALP